MPGWVPFTGLTLVVLCLLLALAHASQRAVDQPPALPPEESAVDATATEQQDADAAEGQDPADAPTDDPLDAEQPVDTGPVTITGDSDAVTAADARATDPGSAQSPAATETPELSTGALLANVALTQGLFGAVVAAAAWYYRIPATALGLAGGAVATPTFVVLVGAVFGVLLWTANELGSSVADAVGASYDESLREMLAPDGPVGWLVLLGVILPVIAGVEELVFRAALVGVPAAGFGVSPWLLAVLSSLAFALGHGAQGRVGIVVTGALGFVLAGGYILSGSLVVVVIAHYLVNALEFVVHEGIGAEGF